MYRFVLTPDHKITFEAVVKYCNENASLIPLSFVLGFYVQVVMTRWWNQYTSIPWPDPIAVFVSATVHGLDERVSDVFDIRYVISIHEIHYMKFNLWHYFALNYRFIHFSGTFDATYNNAICLPLHHYGPR